MQQNMVQYIGLNGTDTVATINCIHGRVENLQDFVTTNVNVTEGSTTTFVTNSSIKTYTTPINISNTHTRNLRFFLVTQDKKEYEIKLINWENLAIREGHIISVISLKTDKKSTPYCFIYNQSIEEYYWKRKVIEDFLNLTAYRYAEYFRVSTAKKRYMSLGILTSIVCILIIIIDKYKNGLFTYIVLSIIPAILISFIIEYIKMTKTDKIANRVIEKNIKDIVEQLIHYTQQLR